MVCIGGCGLSLSGWGKGGGGPGRNTGINCGGTSNLFCSLLNLTCNNNRTKHHVYMYMCVSFLPTSKAEYLSLIALFSLFSLI